MMGPEAEVKPTEEGEVKQSMCSVSGCRSGFTSEQLFWIPDDPEIRLQWVEFLATANKQRFKESVWTDIRVCMEHFKEDCFIKTCISANTYLIRLLPRAVPSVFIKQEEEDPHLESIKTEPVENTDVPCKSEELKTCDSPTPCTEESKPVLEDKGSSVPFRVLPAFDSSTSVLSVRDSLQAHDVNRTLIRQKFARLKMEGKYIVNEKLILQLLSWKCPVCDSKLKVEKVMYGLLLVLNQKCLQCNYRHQWKSQADAEVPTEEDQPMGDAEITSEAVETVQTEDIQSSVTGGPQTKDAVNEENDQMEESGESEGQDDEDSDEDWTPKDKAKPANKLPNEQNNSHKEDDDPPFEPAEEDSQLCTDCGRFFNKRRSHTCLDKTKPFSCNICGVRCTSEVALKQHSRIHDANYMYSCRFCYSTFKTRAYKLCHQRTHRKEKKPYKCRKCPELFSSRTERSNHIKEHRGPKQLKCSHCGVEFCEPSGLQRHLLVHTDEKPFRCSVCDRGFNQASHLKSHMRLHTGERPFKCQHCDKSFNHNVSLKSHVQRYHSPNSGGNPTNGNKTLSKTIDAKENKNKTAAESGFGSVLEEQAQTKDAHRSRRRRRSDNPEETPESCKTISETCEQQEQKLERKSTEGNGDESSVRCLESEEKKEERCKKVRNNTRPQKRAEISDSDSDFDPKDTKKKKYKTRGKK